jgi:hypothetical protein
MSRCNVRLNATVKNVGGMKNEAGKSAQAKKKKRAFTYLSLINH